MAYQVDILDNSLNYKATVTNLAPLDNSGIFLKYSRKLSARGECHFRIGTLDPLLTSEGDILKPFANHVRIKRFGVVVWQGVIVKNPARTKNYIDVTAYTYLYLLSRVLINHDTSPDPNYRTFKSGTMASNITTILTEAQTVMGLPIAGLTAGTIDNPNYPADYKDSLGNALSGTWTFTENFQLKFDYRDILYVIETLGIYSVFDFELTDALVFNFKSFIGNKQPNLVFSWGEFGNIEDFNVPRDGDKMANFLQGVAADNQFNILHAEQSDNVSIGTYGRIAAVAAYGDVKNVNLLNSRLREELLQVSTPDGELHVTLNDRAYPLGQWGVGDTATYQISRGAISVSKLMRIVGYEVKVHDTGKETIRQILNVPRDTQ